MSSENTSRAYKFIRGKILSGEYPPGASLGTKPLADEIGVSRTPVRDALRQLETDGLVIIRPSLGTAVKFMSLQDFKDHCGLRKALEGYAAGLAAENRTDSELEEIRQANQAMKNLFATLKYTFRFAAVLATLAVPPAGVAADSAPSGSTSTPSPVRFTEQLVWNGFHYNWGVQAVDLDGYGAVGLTGVSPPTPSGPNPRKIQFPFGRETGEDPSSPA